MNKANTATGAGTYRQLTPDTETLSVKDTRHKANYSNPSTYNTSVQPAVCIQAAELRCPFSCGGSGRWSSSATELRNENVNMHLKRKCMWQTVSLEHLLCTAVIWGFGAYLRSLRRWCAHSQECVGIITFIDRLWAFPCAVLPPAGWKHHGDVQQWSPSTDSGWWSLKKQNLPAKPTRLSVFPFALPVLKKCYFK